MKFRVYGVYVIVFEIDFDECFLVKLIFCGFRIGVEVIGKVEIVFKFKGR